MGLAERVLIGASVRSAITAHVRAAPKTETGGILIRRDAGAGTLDIVEAEVVLRPSVALVRA